MLLLQHRDRPGAHFALTRSRSSTISVRAAQPCLVLSNDDGVESYALQSLAARLRKETGHRVLVVAPARNKSAASMGLTLRYDMELRVRPDLGPDTYALAGTPTDCMMVALDATKGLMRALDLHPILALSGPNYGPNMGTDVLLSGTVGAARTAGLYGVPSLASSSTSTDKSSALDNAVEATLALAGMALEALGCRPARNWPRNHVVVGGIGRRHVASTCEYESLPHNWVMDVEQVLVDAFQDGDVFLNLNVPAEWRPGSGRVATTGLGLMFYRDSYVVSVPGRPNMLVTSADASIVKANGNGNGNGAIGTSSDEPQCATVNGNGNGDAFKTDVVQDIAEALAAGLPVVYNNAYDTRRTMQIDRSDVMALQSGHVSISTLQAQGNGGESGRMITVMVAW
ncbi:hypothetical protein VOLCADRAFT_119256 [Volvox carteri f. nagariensis]|uniref:Survival protein SurE-like phosphatase/nucleotidase domain-containing protein n=1 Tax=Volvox carteri f. nagariensis TaxID=3068 RepID=D8UBE3_VOLCA|nr:uncharacterized protein VOLCADRAFT_119256 [Volvox carteri f. nagariensis]EFJ42934.1 hypothetical protein VOLCADRAFT_119256 [Volvox carteri f. nagariensis]|eukprot:XP_002955974.1 hypothetical protein VOLCADRAFT_119256 [Volvox carteri f. nagariensis]